MFEHPTRRDFIGAGAAACAALLWPRSTWPAAAHYAAVPFRTASTLAEAIRRGEISSVEVTRSVLDAIIRLGPKLNAFANVLEESAMAEAAAADAARMSGAALGPLHGVPVAIKDAHGIKGVPNTAGSEALKEYRPTVDSAVVSKLRRAGAVVLGNTIVPFMLSDWQSYNPMYGTANNPWDPKRTPGGSSGGSAAAVAAGLAWLATGSDVGGSIRVPAHFCGIYGHKPTIGVVSLRDELPSPPGLPLDPPPELPVNGPLARSAEDLHLAMSVLGGPDAEESVAWTWTMPAPRRARLADFRVGVVFDHPSCPVSSEVQAPMSRMIGALTRAGVAVTEGWPPGLRPADDFWTYYYLLKAELRGRLGPEKVEALRVVAARPETSMETVEARALTASLADFERQETRRIEVRAAWQDWFKRFDVLLMPTAFTPAFQHMQGPVPERRIRTPDGERAYSDMMWWIHQATLAGLPATTAPIGRSPAGLPVGVQIVGPFLEDATPIAFARLLADELGGYEVPPIAR